MRIIAVMFRENRNRPVGCYPHGDRRYGKRVNRPALWRSRVLRTMLLGAWAIGILLSAAGAPLLAQSNLDAGKSPAQIFSDTCNACHRSPREVKRTSAAFLREHYTTGMREATAMAAYLASIGSDPNAIQHRRPPAMGAGQAPPAETATARPSSTPQPADQPKAEAQAAAPAPAPAAALPADQPKPMVGTTGSRRPSQSIELGSAAQGPMAATAPQTAAIPPRRRYPGEDIEE
jgi:hypothetical protein